MARHMNPLKPWAVWFLVGHSVIMISAITIGATVLHGWRRGMLMAGVATFGTGVPLALMLSFGLTQKTAVLGLVYFVILGLVRRYFVAKARNAPAETLAG
jgi:hypothetical protein